jgi:hypothetical protein
MNVTELVADGQRYVTDEAKAEVLMDTFFLTPPLPEGRDPDRAVRGRVGHDIRWPSLSEERGREGYLQKQPR